MRSNLLHIFILISLSAFSQDFPYLPDDTTICQGELTLTIPESDFNELGCISLLWTGEDFQSNDLVTTFSTAGIFVLDAEGCDFNHTFELIYETYDDISLADTLICEDQSIVVEFPIGDFPNLYDFTWMFDGDVLGMEQDSSIIITETGIYSLILEGCSTNVSHDFTVNLYDYPLLFTDFDLFGDSILTICLEDNPVLITPYEDSTHTWFVDGIQMDTLNFNESTFDLEEILDEINLNQVYAYDVEIDFECGIIPSRNTVLISLVECECGLDMPNIFTPDGNEINDFFKPFNNFDGEFVDAESLCKSTNFQMEIFNQWGKNIYSVNSNDEMPYWDGYNANGKKMNSGVYFYRITYQVNVYSLPEMKEITGYFYLY